MKPLKKRLSILLKFLGFCMVAGGIILIVLGCTVLSYHPFGDPWFGKTLQLGALVPGIFLIVISIPIFIVGINAGRTIETAYVTILSTHMSVSRPSASITYYATIEFKNGEQKELYVPQNLSPLIIEGCKGQLTYKSKYITDFIKTNNPEQNICSYCKRPFSKNEKMCAGCGNTRELPACR